MMDAISRRHIRRDVIRDALSARARLGCVPLPYVPEQSGAISSNQEQS